MLKEIPSQVCRYMEMINYVPKLLEPNFDAINKTINRQRDAMLARATEKGEQNPDGTNTTPTLPGQQPLEGLKKSKNSVAEGGPSQNTRTAFNPPEEKAIAVKKRRQNRNAVKELDVNGTGGEKRKQRSSKERAERKRKRRERQAAAGTDGDGKRKSRHRDREHATKSNALDSMVSHKTKGGDPDAGNLR